MPTIPSGLRRRSFLALAGKTALCALSAPALALGAPAVTTLTGGAFGTHWRVSLPAGAAAGALREPIEALLAEIDRQMSPWRADSEISCVNAGRAGRYTVSSGTARVAGMAIAVARDSDGLFDPTVGPLVARWGFGPISGDEEQGWSGVAVAPRAIEKPRDGVTLDLCGVAKGYALDRIGALLVDRGYGSFLGDLGGELAARGLHPSGRAWHVGVEDPRPGTPGVREVLTLDAAAVATSGSKSNSYGVGDRRYSHIIDPRTGEPVTGDLLSVSVVAAEAMHADAWATACMAAGAEGGPRLAKRHGLAALFLFHDGAGIRRHTTTGFDTYLA